MAKQPGDRYATAADLADDLRRFLGHEPIRARRIGPVGRTLRWCRRNPRLTAALVAIAALTGVYVQSLLAENHALERLYASEKQEWAAWQRVGDVEKEMTVAQGKLKEADAEYQAIKTRNHHESARLLRLSPEPGRRWKILEQLGAAEKLRQGP